MGDGVKINGTFQLLVRPYNLEDIAMRKTFRMMLHLLFIWAGQTTAITCDIANPTLPCDLDGMPYDTFAGNYSGNRSFYKASSYDVDISGGYLCLSIKDGLPHNNGYAYVANYGATVWTSPLHTA